MRDSIVHPDGRLPKRPDNLVPLLEWAVNPPGLRPIKKEFPGQIPSKRCVGKPRSLSDEEQRLKVQREHRPLRVANLASLVEVPDMQQQQHLHTWLEKRTAAVQWTGPGTLQVGQMGRGFPRCPILSWLRAALCFAGAERQDVWAKVLLPQLQPLQQSLAGAAAAAINGSA